MTDLSALSATALRDLLSDGSISAVQALDYFEQRLQRLNPALNAIVTTDFEAARSRAQLADAALARGESWGPLHGLPMTLKDNIETAHLPTSYGVEGFRDYRPARDADVTRQLLEAGAIIFGKTNLPAFGTDTQTFNDLHGQTNNPWDLTRTPGGSSGGAAAALAAGLTPLEIGNDIGGSIRLPAHFCGLYGHKSSFGLVSGHGPKPWEDAHSHYSIDPDLQVTGPLARSAADLMLAMNIIAAPPATQRPAMQSRLPPPRASQLSEFRVGVWLTEPDYEVETGMAAVLGTAIDKLREAGAQIVPAKPGVSLRRSHELRNELEAATLSHTCPEDRYQWALEEAVKAPAGRSAMTYAQSVTMRCRDWHSLHRERQVMREQWHRYFEQVDVLLCPVARINAHPHDPAPLAARKAQLDDETLRYWPVIGPWNALSLVAYLPATVAPVGHTPDGLPVGLQIIGPYMQDTTTLQFAQCIELILGPWRPPSAFAG